MKVGPADPLWILRLSRAFEQSAHPLSDEKLLKTEAWLVRVGWPLSRSPRHSRKLLQPQVSC